MRLLEDFFKTAKAKPDEIVLSDGASSHITWRELEELSGKVYRYLEEKEIGREDFVMLLLPRGIWSFACMLGVWRAGAAFVALEKGYPDDRVDYIKNDCGCKLTLDLEIWREILEREALEGYEKAAEHDAAFAVYTSGSTGRPKGVLHEYGNLDRIPDSIQVPIERVGMMAPTNFVAAVIMYLLILRREKMMFVIPYSIVKDTKAIADYYAENEIDITFFAPSAYGLFSKLPSLRNIVVSSEPCYGIWSEDPGLNVYNFYVSSESGFIVAAAHLDSPNETAPIGKPTTDIKIRLLDEEGQPVPDGEEGEICFEDPYVRGYINLPDETAAVFAGGEYHTRDLGKKLDNGDYVIIGRIDDMVKINGNRVEPAEVENATRRLLGLKQVLAKGIYEGRDAYICLYYADDIRLDEDEARKKLLTALPYYMLPSHFIHLEVLPRTATGKLSRAMLPKPERKKDDGTHTEPETGEEKALCRAFASVLGLEMVGADDDFYSLGGSSVSSMELVAVCELPELNVSQIFRGRTPRKIAEIYLQERTRDTQQTKRDRIRKAMELSHPLTTEQLYMFDYQMYTPKSTMYNLGRLVKFNDKIEAERLADAVNGMIRNHPALMTTLFFNEDGEIMQRYSPELFTPVRVEEVTEEELAGIKDTLIHPFERLTDTLLVRNRIFKTEESVYWYNEIHHMFFDGSSGRVMLSDVCGRYLKGAACGEDEPDAYYLMLTEREQQKKSGLYAESRSYFEGRYGNKKWSTRLACEIASRRNGYAEDGMEIDVPEDELSELMEQAHLSGNGIFMIPMLLAMASMNNKRNVMCAWVYRGRDSKELQEMVGLLFRELPMALSIDPELTMGELYQDVGDQILEGIAHSCYPYMDKNSLVKTSDNFVFIYQEDNWDPYRFMPIDMEEMEIDYPCLASETAMDVEIVNGEEGLEMFLEYSDDRYRPEDVRRYMEIMMRFLRAMVKFRREPERTLRELFAEAGQGMPERD